MCNDGLVSKPLNHFLRCRQIHHKCLEIGKYMHCHTRINYPWVSGEISLKGLWHFNILTYAVNPFASSSSLLDYSATLVHAFPFPFPLLELDTGFFFPFILFLISMCFTFVCRVLPILICFMSNFSTTIALWCILSKPTAILGDVVVSFANRVYPLLLFGVRWWSSVGSVVHLVLSFEVVILSDRINCIWVIVKAGVVVYVQVEMRWRNSKK